MVKLVSPAINYAQSIRAPPDAGMPYSVPVPGTERRGRTPVFRHWRFPDRLLESLDPQIKTCHDFFEQTASLVPANKCLGRRIWDSNATSFGPYVWEDFQTIQNRRKNLGAGLRILHQRIGLDGKLAVGLFCNNRPEWQITDLACMSQSFFTVSLYDTLGPDAVEFIVNHAKLACVVASLDHVPTLLNIKHSCPSLKIIVCLDSMYENDAPKLSKGDLIRSFAARSGVQIYSFEEVETLGNVNPLPYRPPGKDDVVTINYTSGTTGEPKGVTLTHRNAVAATSAAMLLIEQRGEDLTCSFLPLAHIFQRLAEHISLWGGGSIGYFHGDMLELVDDLKLLRPTAFCAVPRLYNRIGSKIKTAALDKPSNPIRGALSKHVVGTKLGRANNPNPKLATNKHWLWDKLWSSRVASQIGLERCHSMVSGSAPIDPEVHQFLRICFANNMAQGYGLTETYAVVSCQAPGDMSVGNCGGVCPTGEVCLRDVPDMEYLATDQPFPRGELLVRGNVVFRGYHGNAEETAKCKDSEGWFATGDIASIDNLGRISIVDRVKNLLKLAQGEYVSPERLENKYLANLLYLKTAYIHGDSQKASLVGLFDIDPEAFAEFAGSVMDKTIDATDVEALKEACQDGRVRQASQMALASVAEEHKFNRYEQCRAHYLFVDEFRVDNNMLTPTLKIKRPEIRKVFRRQLDQLYAEIDQQATLARVKALL